MAGFAREIRGEALKPLYKSVPQATKRDPRLYRALTLVDAIRAGRVRERKLAEKLLLQMLVDEGSGRLKQIAGR